MFFPKLISIARNVNKFISLFIHAFIQQILTEIAVCVGIVVLMAKW